MSLSGIGKITARAAEAAGAVGSVVSGTIYPESEYALAAYLFDRIAQAEKEQAERSRAYYLELMATCLETARGGKPPA